MTDTAGPESAIRAVEDDPEVGQDTPIVGTLDGMSFESAEVFTQLVERHELETTVHLRAKVPIPFSWSRLDGDGDLTTLSTGYNQITRLHHSGEKKPEGTASFVHVEGPAHATVPLYRDVYGTAVRVEGVLQPLMPRVRSDGWSV